MQNIRSSKAPMRDNEARSAKPLRHGRTGATGSLPASASTCVTAPADQPPVAPAAHRGSSKRRRGDCASRGFTIMELLVAVTLMLLLIFLINRLFRDTANAIGQGVGMSNILNTTRVVSEQLDEDGQQMVGPREGGFMVLLVHDVSSLIVESAGNTEATRNVADDAIMFIRRRGNSESITPGQNNVIANNARGPYGRVWLGHGLRTKANGTDDPDLGVNTNGSYNQFANEWVMVRQHLILDPTFNAGNASSINAAHDSLPGNTVYASPPAPGLQLYRGLTDVARVGLETLTGTGGSLAPTTGPLTTAAYRTAVYPLTFGNQRLRVNPTPEPHPTQGVTAWMIAMMHPYLAGNVSDIEIHFAADIDSSGAMDIDGGGNIIWYGRGNLPATSYAPYDDDPTDELAHADRAFVWRHDEPADWPYLIRIRYQLHDPQKRGSGRWFEQIIAVPRER